MFSKFTSISAVFLAFVVATPSAWSATRSDDGLNETEVKKQDTDYKYVTQQSVVLTGILTTGDATEKTGYDVMPSEIVLPEGAEFRILERLETEGQYFSKIELQTGDRENTVISYWVDESALVKELFAGEKDSVSLNFDQMNPSDAKFNFAGNYAEAANGAVTFIVPIVGARKSSPPGMRFHPIKKKKMMHNGWDYAAPTGTPVMAAAAGTVSVAGVLRGYGNAIYIKHGKMETRYAHLSKILVKKGQNVNQGQVIGKVGSTGMSTGPHLHFEKRDANGKPIVK